VAVLAAGTHLRTVGFGFVFDDLFLVADNQALREPWAPVKAFGRHFWYGTPFDTGYYRPVVNASLALNGRILGWGPGGFHLVNVLLHAGNAALLLGLLRRFGVALPAAGLAAALFAVHPVAAWPVGSIVARVDLLPALFLLLAWRAYPRPIPTGVWFLLALLCKESAVAFIVVPLMGLRLLDEGRPAPSGDAGRSERRATAVACFVAVVIYLGMRLALGVGLGPGIGRVSAVANPLAHLPQPGRLYAALELSGRYLLYLLVPAGLSDPRSYLSTPPPLTGEAIASGAILLAWGGAAFILWRSNDRTSVPLAFSLAAFLPASNLLVPIGSLYAQNFLYLPLVGLCLAIGPGLDRLSALYAGSPDPGRVIRWARGAALAGSLPLLALLAVAAMRESAIWRDGRTLFSTWAERFPHYALAHSRLGIALLDSGDAIGATERLRRAVAMDGRNDEAHYNLGVALLVRSPQDPEALRKALEHSRMALDIDPRLVQARVNASRILRLLGRHAEAEAEAREALRLEPRLGPARLNLAEALFAQSRYKKAAEEFGALAGENPADPAIRSPYVVALIRAGDLEAARRAAEAARRDFPDLAWFDFCLARVEARSGRPREALALLRLAAGRDAATRDWIGQVDDFKDLRRDPEFRALTRTPGAGRSDRPPGPR
jgi:tetratricopeptide (TPR) repeat protein